MVGNKRKVSFRRAQRRIASWGALPLSYRRLFIAARQAGNLSIPIFIVFGLNVDFISYVLYI